MKWKNLEIEPNDIIAIYRTNLKHRSTTDGLEPAFFMTPQTTFGETLSTVQYERLDIHAGHPPEYFYIAHSRRNKILRKKELSLFKNWMEIDAPIYGNIPVSKLKLGGAHDGAAQMPFNADFFHSQYKDNQVLCQQETIKSLLCHGVRYLDLRVTEEDGDFWILHGIFKIKLFAEVCADIKSFLEETKECVIADLHQVEGLDEDGYERLHSFLMQFFSDHVYPNGTIPCYNQMVIVNRRLILTVQKSPIMRTEYFPAVPHIWPDDWNVNNVAKYLKEKTPFVSQRTNFLHSSMAAATRSLVSFAYDAHGLREKAEEMAPVIEDLLEDDQFSEHVNIISFDFVLCCRAIEMCIQLNRDMFSN